MSAASDKASVAVLPFKTLSWKSELRYFIAGMVGDLSADLSRFPSLRVISRSATAR
jgi:TolB-like protein